MNGARRFRGPPGGDRTRPRSRAARAAPARRAAGARRAGYRLGVDVGGTFTDLLLLDEKRVAHVHGQGALDARRFLDRRARTASRKICRDAGHRPARHRRRHAWHDGRDQHRADQRRRARRAGHDQGISRRAPDRAVLCSRRSRRLGDLQQAAAAGAAGDDDRGERAHRRGRRVLIPLDEIALRRDLAALAGKGIEALTVSLFNAYVDGKHERRIAEIAARSHAQYSGVDLLGRHPGDVRIRAHRDDGRQFLHPAGRLEIHPQSRGANCDAR